MKYPIIFCIFLSFIARLSAQQEALLSVSKAVIVNFSELAAKQKDMPMTKNKAIDISPNAELEAYISEQELEEEVMEKAKKQNYLTKKVVSHINFPKQFIAPTENNVLSTSCSFQAQPDDGSHPPDTHGAVGPQHVMALGASGAMIQTKSGVTYPNWQLNLTTFFNALAPSGKTVQVFDARILYDPYYDRWILLELNNPQSANPNCDLTQDILLAVSQTGDPTQNWYLYAINSDFESPYTWVDFPNIGINKQWIAITGNSSNNVFLVGKMQAYAGINPTVDRISLSGCCFAPATIHDNTTTKMYIADNGISANGIYNSIRIHEITGNVGAAVVSAQVYSGVANLTWTGGGTNTFPQLGGALSPVNSMGNFVVTKLVYRNGHLWFSKGVGYNNPTRTSILWGEIDPTNYNMVQFGMIDDPLGNDYYTYPSIDVNAAGDVMIGYTRFNATNYPCAGYSYRLASNPPNTLSGIVIFKIGTHAYSNIPDGNGYVRWGDYSATQTDPNEVTFWTNQEVTAPPIVGRGWSTWWGCYDDNSSCIPLYILTAPILETRKYEASDYIKSSSKILAGSDIIYDAHNYVDLEEGFYVDNNSLFYSYIDGCGNLRIANSETTSTFETGFAHYSEGIEFNAYPNPFSGIVNIDISIDKTTNVTLNIYDVAGNNVANLLSNKLIDEKTQHAIQWNSKGLSAGSYIYKMQVGNKEISGKLVKIE